MLPNRTMQSAPNTGVEWAYEYVLDVAKGEECLLEENVSYERDGEVLYSGYADVIVGNHILDYKESSEGYYRPQLNGYAAAWMQKTFKEELTCHVLYGQTQRADVWTITADEADEYVTSIFEIVNSENKTPTANEYCKWCANLSGCSGVNELMVSAIQEGLIVNFDCPERLSAAKKLVPIFKAWIDGVDKLTKSTLESGGEVPGYRLSERNGRQFVSNDFFAEVAMQSTVRNYDITKVLEQCSITVPKAKALFKDITGNDLPQEFLPRSNKTFAVLADKTKKID